MLALILMAAVIFGFSHQSGEESSKLSGAIAEWIASRWVPGFSTMEAADQQTALERLELVVRKLAHFSEYLVLATLLCYFFYNLFNRFEVFRSIGLSWSLATLYAATDELHQMFVANRGPAITDVLIDSAGALLGSVLLSALMAGYLHRRARGRH